MKKKKKILISLTAVTALLAIGMTFAFMFRQTGQIVNEFVPATVSCSVVEEFNGEQKTSIQVKNKSNIDCYLRVRLVSYWVNEKDEIVGKPSVIPTVDVNDGWIKGREDVYYYTTPVGAGKTTESNLLNAPLVLTQEEYNGETVYQVVEVFAEAIQAEPIEAVETAWPDFTPGSAE